MTHIPVPPLPNPYGPGLLGQWQWPHHPYQPQRTPWNTPLPRIPPPPPKSSDEIQREIERLLAPKIDAAEHARRMEEFRNKHLKELAGLNDIIIKLNEDLIDARPSLAAAPRAPRIRAFLRLCRRFGRWVERMDW